MTSPASGPPGEHARRAERAYAAAADHYTRPSLSFWDHFGAATVSRLRLVSGQDVLDLCCGTGASAIPAARAVGPSGRVLGIDVVICVFGVFFAPDMTAFITRMWRLLRPGGVLAVTTWGPGLFEPANSLFWEAVREVEPSLFKAYNPWDEITTPQALAGLFARAGVPDPAVVAVPGQHHLDRPDQFWDVVLGSGYRATVDALGPQQRDRLHARLLGELWARDVTALRTDVVFGTAWSR